MAVDDGVCGVCIVCFSCYCCMYSIAFAHRLTFLENSDVHHNKMVNGNGKKSTYIFIHEGEKKLENVVNYVRRNKMLVSFSSCCSLMANGMKCMKRCFQFVEIKELVDFGVFSSACICVCQCLYVTLVMMMLFFFYFQRGFSSFWFATCNKRSFSFLSSFGILWIFGLMMMISVLFCTLFW